jgi:hypothetical protein
MLTAQHILQAAQRDIAVYSSNRAVKGDRQSFKREGADPRNAGKSRPVVFLLAHVRHSRRASDLLSRALAGRIAGQSSKAPATSLVYSSDVLLNEALKLALQHEGGLR